VSLRCLMRARQSPKLRTASVLEISTLMQKCVKYMFMQVKLAYLAT
jgi:hypothetical protein